MDEVTKKLIEALEKNTELTKEIGELKLKIKDLEAPIPVPSIFPQPIYPQPWTITYGPTCEKLKGNPLAICTCPECWKSATSGTIIVDNNWNGVMNGTTRSTVLKN